MWVINNMERDKRNWIAGASHYSNDHSRKKNWDVVLLLAGNKLEELGYVYSDEYHKSDYSDSKSINKWNMISVQRRKV